MADSSIFPPDWAHMQWLRANLSTAIPPKVPMGETLLDHWTPDEIASEEYAGWDLGDGWALRVLGRPYRWVTEQELLGQVKLNDQYLRPAEWRAFSTGDSRRPCVIYHRDKRKSVCVTALMQALQDPVRWHLELLRPRPSVYILHFHDAVHGTFAVDVETLESQLYISDCAEFPLEAPNFYVDELYSPSLHDERNEGPEVMQQEPDTPARPPTTLDQTLQSLLQSAGRVPPFVSSGRTPVGRPNRFIKAPFKTLPA